jgi:hypothetical protein
MAAQVIDFAAAAERLDEKRAAAVRRAVREALAETGERTFTARELHQRMLERVRGQHPKPDPEAA